MSATIANLTEATFDETVNSSATPLLVDFWAEWCGPCKAIAPILDEIATEQAGRLTIAKVNVDENNQLPIRFGVQGIPTMIVFKDGQVAKKLVGARGKAQLLEDLAEFL